MRYEVHISAYDVMDVVTIGCILKCQKSVAEGSAVPVLTVGTVIAGQGEDDPREWLIDVLVGLLESV
jgi:hypothetical protein